MPRPLSLALALDRAADTSLSGQVAGQIRDLAAERGGRATVEGERQGEWSWHVSVLSESA